MRERERALRPGRRRAVAPLARRTEEWQVEEQAKFILRTGIERDDTIAIAMHVYTVGARTRGATLRAAGRGARAVL